jgi:hypothetical protein
MTARTESEISAISGAAVGAAVGALVGGLDPTVVSPAAKSTNRREVGLIHRQRPSNRLPATRV